MVSHTYHFHLESDVIRLPNVDDLLGKDVEIVIREVAPFAIAGNFDLVNRLLAQQASATFFNDIEDPTAWQKRVRDEWE